MINKALRSIVLYTALIAAGTALLVWRFPFLHLPTSLPHPAPAQVYFIPQFPTASLAYADIWSPAAIALGNKAYRLPPPASTTPAALPPELASVNIISPSLPSPTPLTPQVCASPFEKLPAAISALTPPIQAHPKETTPQRKWTAATDGRHLLNDLDFSLLEPNSLPIPREPCQLLLWLVFGTDGHVCRAWLDTASDSPELNQAIVRQAYRIRHLNPSHATNDWFPLFVFYNGEFDAVGQ